MADGTKIEWADATVNYLNGCSVVSPGCTNCYAMKLAGTRLAKHPSRAGLTRDSKAGPIWTGETRAWEPALLQVLGWRRPRRIFWNAHGDLFHGAVPDEWIDRQFAVMALTPQHIHMVLTKRPERARAYLTDAATRPRIGATSFINALRGVGTADAEGLRGQEDRPWPLPNVWLGTSVEDQARADERIPHLLATPAAVRFLSCEPLLGAVDLERVDDGLKDGTRLVFNALTGTAWDGEDVIDGVFGNPNPSIDLVIAGGESGKGARDWPGLDDAMRSLRDQCRAAGVAFFLKQMAGARKPLRPIPDDLLIRQLPAGVERNGVPAHG